MSNLSSEVLYWCCVQIGIESNPFLLYQDFIDDHLLKYRNFIAHGESLKVNTETISDFRDKVVDLMRIVENEIENAIVLKKYEV